MYVTFRNICPSKQTIYMRQQAVQANQTMPIRARHDFRPKRKLRLQGFSLRPSTTDYPKILTNYRQKAKVLAPVLRTVVVAKRA